MVRAQSQQRVQFREAKHNAKELLLRQQLAEIHGLQKVFIERRCMIENTQVLAREKEADKVLQKKYGARLKQQPKLLKMNEQQLRKQFTDTLKSTEKQFKSESALSLKALPKGEQELTLKKQKADRMSKLMEMEEQYKCTVAEMADSQNEQLENWYRAQQQLLQEEHEAVRRQLNEYQQTREMALQEKLARETAELAKSIAAALDELRRFEAAEEYRVQTEAERLHTFERTSQQEMADLRGTSAASLRWSRVLSEPK